MPEPGSEAQLTWELAEIAARLSALGSVEPGRSAVASELESIRAQLRMLAEANAEVRERLAVGLGLKQPERPSSGG